MALATYRAKRDFKSTPEPSGRARKAKSTGDSFVIQKHDARRLHYDFRLELDGVLKSWAVTKGPSLVPGEKRLAVHVEDHPLDYGDFEGTIPKGDYGGGTVIVWDRGRWHPVGDPHKGYAKGHLDFDLEGEKLQGRWHLVRMAQKPGEKKENWLLIKADDDAARSGDEPAILDERPESVKTGRAIDDVAGEAPGWSSKTGKLDPPKPKPAAVPVEGDRKAALPDFVAPALATLVAQTPDGKRWLHEVKFDGYRLQARISAGKVTLSTRSGLDWTRRFGKEIQSAFEALPVAEALIDGEVVVEAANGTSDFGELQADLSDSRSDRFRFYAFDLLHLDGKDLRALPLIRRKDILQQVLAEADPERLRFSESFDGDGSVVLDHACRLSMEGIVSKLRDAPYRSGRTRDWVKSKCAARQEFVIAGYVPSSTAMKAIGSLVLGYYEKGTLIHAGRVGTGFTHAVARDLYRRLEKLRRDTSPFAAKLNAQAARQVRHVAPELVAEVEFRDWTADHILRHAAFRGLREDKPAEEVMRETPRKPAGTDAPPASAVTLTHPDRVYWPDAGVTKAGLADYYTEVWPRLAPFVTGRPLALLRCPDGTGGQCFFQKHVWQGASRSIRTVADPVGSQGALIVIDDLDGLIGLVQAGVLELHPWGATLEKLEKPDLIILDLDPAEDVPWPRVIAGAEDVKARLEQAGLTGFVKTSGGKGLHIVAPLVPEADWDRVKDFTKGIAEAMAADEPDRYVATISKAKRQGRILIDYLRNGRGNTAVAPYSTRARAHAPVSMPLGWDELKTGIGPAHFTLLNAPGRLARLKADPWADFRDAAAPIAEKRKKRS
jgi:bifunctional non-homologous end joining protein LigD